MRARALFLLLVLLGCTAPTTPPASMEAGVRLLSTGATPLIDADASTLYYGFPGGLYPGGNAVPSLHDSLARAAAQRLTPRTTSGAPSATGVMVLLSVGFSNTAQVWCAATTANNFPPCTSWSFTGQAKASPLVNKQTLRLFPGAMASQTTEDWASPAAPTYTKVATRLAGKGLREAQVQAVWMEVAHAFPTVSLPNSGADAYTLITDIGRAVRALRVRYPNLQLVFLSSRVYGGYSIAQNNPEPYAYETGYAVQAVVAAQVLQEQGAGVDPLAGDLGPAVAPVVVWGPYTWADGEVARSDGLTWLATDFEADGVHPATAGERKSGTLLLDFFTTSPYARCWMLAARPSC